MSIITIDDRHHFVDSRRNLTLKGTTKCLFVRKTTNCPSVWLEIAPPQYYRMPSGGILANHHDNGLRMAATLQTASTNTNKVPASQPRHATQSYVTFHMKLLTPPFFFLGVSRCLLCLMTVQNALGCLRLHNPPLVPLFAGSSPFSQTLSVATESTGVWWLYS
jgi:hypothetical protein